MSATLLENPDQTVCPSRREAELSALVENLLGEVSQHTSRLAPHGTLGSVLAAKTATIPSQALIP
jgi:hypothetical protein